MKKYKLIKEYPGSPCLGTRLSSINPPVQWPLCNDYYTLENSSETVIFSKKEIENHPEFWEEIIESAKAEKDYKILSFIGSGGTIINKIYSITPDNRYIYSTSHDSFSLEYMINSIDVDDNHNPVKIHSVKCLSDGKIFTISDKIQNKTTSRIYNIDEILLKDDHIKFYHKCTIGGFLFTIDEVNKFKKPLFTTVDGVSIYDSKTIIHGVNISKCGLYWEGNYEYTTKDHAESVNTNNFKWFSTKEAAQQYIIENKPCLSYNDVMIMINTTSNGKILLKNLIESRLNL